ncbi:hypothetical protein CgunFtcFv8_013868 [Champsocephalus gunnari]|uniref:Uncharacterized protein n=1 Tax=Champsocephalus gunnari TaxID=52237 RepID=A0AAN8HYQ6_CHAGU|nr:hypothetical protein CgunFtcFv8_013868 [Champsocephalus gunnari]
MSFPVRPGRGRTCFGTTSVIYQLGRGLCRLSRKSSERPWVHRSATTMLSASCATEEEQVMNMDFRRMWRRWRGDTGAWINFISWVTIFSFDLIYLKGSEPILLRPSSSHAVRTLLSSRLSRGRTIGNSPRRGTNCFEYFS